MGVPRGTCQLYARLRTPADRRRRRSELPAQFLPLPLPPRAADTPLVTDWQSLNWRADIRYECKLDDCQTVSQPAFISPMIAVLQI